MTLAFLADVITVTVADVLNARQTALALTVDALLMHRRECHFGERDALRTFKAFERVLRIQYH